MLNAKLESIEDYYMAYDFVASYLTQLENVVARLHKELGTNFFSLCRVHDRDLFGTCIATNLDLGEFWFTTGKPFPVPPQSGFFLADRLPMFYSTEFIHNIKDSYGLDNLLFYVEHRKKYVDIYGFASEPNRTEVIYKYLNGGTNTILKFIPYFREHFKNIIDEGEKRRHLIYIQNEAVYLNPFFSSGGEIEKTSTQYSSIQIKQFESDLKHLPDRIYDAVQLSALGFTAKQSAKELNIGYRTIEGYIASAKSKLKVSNLQQLRDLFAISTA